jgi:hypothetical protein
MAESTNGSVSPQVIKAEYYTAIGRVAAAWAHLELIINHSIWELANVEQRIGACITAQIISPGARFRTLVALVAERGGSQEAIKSLNSFSSEVDARARERNRIVHDPSFVTGDTGVFHQLQITADRKLEFDFKPLTLDHIQSTEKKIIKLISRYVALIEGILAGLPHFSRQQFRRSSGVDPRSQREDLPERLR